MPRRPKVFMGNFKYRTCIQNISDQKYEIWFSPSYMSVYCLFEVLK